MIVCVDIIVRSMAPLSSTDNISSVSVGGEGVEEWKGYHQECCKGGRGSSLTHHVG